jgi:hypothetical protein|tara:strand:- start:1438 stop:1620 length:183 start_codon:yes stop_codon:yes gene_type:complete
MFKVLLGAAIVVGLVGYGVITPDHLENAGSTMKTGVNASAGWVKQQTEKNTIEQAKELIK